MRIPALNPLTNAPVALDMADGCACLLPGADTPPPANVFLSPGWFDLQVNGFAGYDINAPDVEPATVAGMVRRLWQEGVARCCPTIVTQSFEHMARCARAVALACEQDAQIAASVAGIHLEGPYISPVDGARGAHPREHVRPASWDEFARWQEMAGGRIRLVSLAPETPGALPFIRRLRQAGVVVGLAHTLATTDEIAAAVDAGATLSTHLGNGSPATLPRHPNMIWDQLAEDRLWASAIFDGHHLPASVMKVIARAKGITRTILVSDAVALARMAPGIYDTAVGGKVELHPNGRLSVFGTPYLAGSASALKDCVENAVRLAGCSLAQAVQMASANPAKLLEASDTSEVSDTLSTSLTLFRWDDRAREATILATIVDGAVVYSNDADSASR